MSLKGNDRRFWIQLPLHEAKVLHAVAGRHHHKLDLSYMTKRPNSSNLGSELLPVWWTRTLS